MDDALGLAEYLPTSFKTPSEQEYIAFLWATFEINYNALKFQFAFLAYHMLMMSFVYERAPRPVRGANGRHVAVISALTQGCRWPCGV